MDEEVSFQAALANSFQDYSTGPSPFRGGYLVDSVARSFEESPATQMKDRARRRALTMAGAKCARNAGSVGSGDDPEVVAGKTFIKSVGVLERGMQRDFVNDFMAIDPDCSSTDVVTGLAVAFGEKPTSSTPPEVVHLKDDRNYTDVCDLTGASSE